jgi:F-type H+-transporting ATPase subunit gamma
MRKITSAMKMVAASKLRRAQEQAQVAQPYAQRMAGILSRLAANYVASESSPKLLAGTGKDQVHLVVVVTSDRGLAGGFNSNSVRAARGLIRDLLAQGKEVKLLTVGRKAKDLLRRDQASRLGQTFEGIGAKRVTFAEAENVSRAIVAMYEAGEFDVCTIVYNRFKSVISQIPTVTQLIPFALPEGTVKAESHEVRPVYEFAGGADDRDGQRLTQCRGPDQETDAPLQPRAPGRHHQGTDRNRVGRGSALDRSIRLLRKRETSWPIT